MFANFFLLLLFSVVSFQSCVAALALLADVRLPFLTIQTTKRNAFFLLVTRYFVCSKVRSCRFCAIARVSAQLGALERIDV